MPIQNVGDETSRPTRSFAAGPWFCIGAPLARMEMDLALGGIFRRLPGLHLHLSVEEISQSIDRHSGGLATLPVAWNARGSARGEREPSRSDADGLDIP